uniref:Uncharacterized protein n=1 Tax=Staphylococcus aureus TaxID=1280 RepID=Q3T2M8_STAAU|nr:hypothetical protein [Staphylococcus aureus]
MCKFTIKQLISCIFHELCYILCNPLIITFNHNRIVYRHYNLERFFFALCFVHFQQNVLENIACYRLYINCHNTTTLKCAHIMFNAVRRRHCFIFFDLLLKFNDLLEFAHYL